MQMSAKNLDSKGRFRSRTIGFRVSPEEEKLINSAVALSGLTKQDYIVKRLLCRDVVVQGNPRVYKALKNQLAEVLSELQRIENSSVSDELLETIRLINTTLNGMKDEENPDVRRKRNDRSERIYWRRYGAVIHKTNY
jgi:uncharacterized protein (DUF1778 family)